MPRYRGNLTNYESGNYTDLVGEKMTATLETFSGDIVVEAFTVGVSGPTKEPVDHIKVTVRGHRFQGGKQRTEIVLYSGPIEQLHDENKRDLFIQKLAEMKLEKEFKP